MKRPATRLLQLTALGWAALGCAGLRPPPPDPLLLSAPPPPALSDRSEKSDDGSLWPGDDNGFLFSDHKARRVGDLLTVKIDEKATAIKDSSSDLSHDSSIDAGIDNLFGIEKSVVVHNPHLNPMALVKGSVKNEYKGSGMTKRRDDLTTQMSVVVERVFPNGNLVVYGHRVIALNNEEQLIMLRGIVRPQDIDSKNTVLSTSIANAEIRYGGKGVVSDKQRPGWFSWLFDWVWPL